MIDLRDRLTLLFGDLEWRIDRVSRNPAVVNAAYAAFFGTAVAAVGSAAGVAAGAGAAIAGGAAVIVGVTAVAGRGGAEARVVIAAIAAVAAVAVEIGGVVAAGGAVAGGGVHWILQHRDMDQGDQVAIGLGMAMGGVANLWAIPVMDSSPLPIVLLIPLIGSFTSWALSRLW